jgi:hypothetical protein
LSRASRGRTLASRSFACAAERFSSRNAGKWSATMCDHFVPARSRLIRPWTCWLGAPTPVCYMGEGLRVWTGRGSTVDTRRHAGRERVHRAALMRRVGAPRVDRVDVTGLRQSELISPGDDKRLPRGLPACCNLSCRRLCRAPARRSIWTSHFRISCGQCNR